MKKLIGLFVLSGLLLNMPTYGYAQNIALNKPVVTSSVQSGTSYTGNLAVDGNTGRPSTAAFGIDIGNYPNNQKQYIIGLNLSF